MKSKYSCHDFHIASYRQKETNHPNFQMTPITKEEANTIMADQWKKAPRRVVLLFRNQWYDIRGLDDAAVRRELKKLTGENVPF